MIVSTTPTSTGHYVELTITPPSQAPVSLSAGFIFVVDISSSMEGPRLDTVKAMIGQCLDKISQKMLSGSTSFHVSIIQYHTLASTVHSGSNCLVFKRGDSVDGLKEQVAQMRAEGGTSMLAGAEGFTAVITSSFSSVSALGVVFLTDGEDDCFKRADLSQMQSEWKSHRVNLFSVGIGAHHDVEALKHLITDNKSKQVIPNATYFFVEDANEDASRGSSRFRGQYDLSIAAGADAQPAARSTEATTLTQLIKAVFNATVGQVYRSIQLSATLGDEVVPILNASLVDRSFYALGSLSAGEVLQRYIKVDSGDKPLNLEWRFEHANQAVESITTAVELSSSDFNLLVYVKGLRAQLVAIGSQIRGVTDPGQRGHHLDQVRAKVENLGGQKESLSSAEQVVVKDIQLLWEDLTRPPSSSMEATTRFTRFGRGRFDRVEAD